MPACRVLAAGAAVLASITVAAVPQGPWVPDLGNGRYRNPVLYTDYSDPDAVRVGDDYFLISSSFAAVPGIPILHSKDLVNWRLINHALPRLVPEEAFREPQHGGGVWAPSLRHHDGRFRIYYPDPDRGIFVTTAADPRDRWSTPTLVKAGKGRIDPCPLWDDDGRVYLIHAWARSRAGFNNVLTLHELDATGTRVVDEGRVVVDGNKLEGYRTLEGPKLYKRDAWYYIFAPAGGVKEGWQSVFRSRAIGGPYESRIVLAQGSTDVNGPHQGALVDTAAGASWFLHFQDLEAYGRVVHLQPVEWRDGWPVMGRDDDGDGTGEPLSSARKPTVAATQGLGVPQTSDEFDDPAPGLQWQWQANPDARWASTTARRGWLRLAAVPAPREGNLWRAPNLLLQKLPAPAFEATAAIEFAPALAGEQAGLIVFGADYAWIGLRNRETGTGLVVMEARAAAEGRPEAEIANVAIGSATVHLRVTFRHGARYAFSYSLDGRSFRPAGGEFMAKPGRWVGAKIGLFSTAPAQASSGGHVDVGRFGVAPADVR